MAEISKEVLEVVTLLRRTTKIESILEHIGGTGGGIWEKADSCDAILKILTYKNELTRIDKELTSKLKEFHYFSQENKIVLNQNLKTWIQSINDCQSAWHSTKEVKKLLGEEKSGSNFL